MVYALNIRFPSLYSVAARPLDGDFIKVRPVDETWDEGGPFNPPWMGGLQVRTDFLPTRMRWDARYAIPDFDMGGCHIAVSERAKGLFERFEPGVHQFAPVDYVGSKSKLLQHRYLLYVCNRIDCLDRDQTTMVLQTIHVRPELVKAGRQLSRMWTPVYNLVVMGRGDLIPAHLPHDTQSTCVFNRAQIGAHHMWCDKLGLSGIWLSDELASAIRDAGLTGVDLSEVSKQKTV